MRMTYWIDEKFNQIGTMNDKGKDLLTKSSKSKNRNRINILYIIIEKIVIGDKIIEIIKVTSIYR